MKEERGGGAVKQSSMSLGRSCPQHSQATTSSRETGRRAGAPNTTRCNSNPANQVHVMVTSCGATICTSNQPVGCGVGSSCIWRRGASRPDPAKTAPLRLGVLLPYPDRQRAWCTGAISSSSWTDGQQLKEVGPVGPVGPARPPLASTDPRRQERGGSWRAMGVGTVL